MSISYIEAFWFRFLLWITPPNKSHWCVWQVWCRSSAARWDVGGACGPWLLHSDPMTGGHIQPDSPPSTAATAEWSPGESPLFLPASSSQHRFLCTCWGSGWHTSWDLDACSLYECHQVVSSLAVTDWLVGTPWLGTVWVCLVGVLWLIQGDQLH